VRSIGRGRAVKAGKAMDVHDMLYFITQRVKRFLGFLKVVETLFFACFGLWRWLAVSRSFFFMEVVNLAALIRGPFHVQLGIKVLSVG
jgi:hypothetical protein